MEAGINLALQNKVSQLGLSIGADQATAKKVRVVIFPEEFGIKQNIDGKQMRVVMFPEDVNAGCE